MVLPVNRAPNQVVASGDANAMALQSNNNEFAIAELSADLIPQTPSDLGAMPFNYRYWQASTASWTPRPDVPVGVHVDAFSELYSAATPPPNALTGDGWYPHPSRLVGA